MANPNQEYVASKLHSGGYTCALEEPILLDYNVRVGQVRQFERLLAAPPRLLDAPNINTLAARLLVEELCRLGASTFAIAPGDALTCAATL